MGSEYPRKGERRRTAIPLRHYPGVVRNQRKSFSTTASAGEVNSTRVPKTALTPISRLKKFQRLRDKNLRKQVLDRNNLRKQLKMLGTVDSTAEVISKSKGSPDIMKGVSRLDQDKSLNGILEESEEVGMNGVDSHTNGVDTNGETPQTNGVELKEVEEDMKIVSGEIEEELHGPEAREEREIEVDVKVLDTSSRKFTPKRQNDYQEQSTCSSAPLVYVPTQNDDMWRNDTLRISGRRPIHRGTSPPRKRKSDDHINEPASKRQAVTPSIPSPGWTFLSPFSLFKRRTPAPGSTRPADDSLFVNVSASSEIDLDLDNSVLDETASLVQEKESQDLDEVITGQPEAKNTSWLCSIM